MTLKGKAADDLHEKLMREQAEHRTRRLADEKSKSDGKEPFDLGKLEALGVDVTVEGRVTDRAQQHTRFEEMYYVQYPELRTLAELAAKETELAKWR